MSSEYVSNLPETVSLDIEWDLNLFIRSVIIVFLDSVSPEKISEYADDIEKNGEDTLLLGELVLIPSFFFFPIV